MRILAIIGTAGRNEDADVLTLAHYNHMYVVAEQLLLSGGYDAVISGGSAWADHIAVRLYLSDKVRKLILCLPYIFDNNNNCYDDNYLNSLHSAFSRKCNISSLTEIRAAIDKGCQVVYTDSATSRQHGSHCYHERNTLIAKYCDDLLAFTFGKGVVPKPGGTLDTWNKTASTVNKIHVSLPVCIP